MAVEADVETVLWRVDAARRRELQPHEVLAGPHRDVHAEIPGMVAVTIKLGIGRAGDRFGDGVGPPAGRDRIPSGSQSRYDLRARTPRVSASIAIVLSARIAKNHSRGCLGPGAAVGTART